MDDPIDQQERQILERLRDSVSKWYSLYDYNTATEWDYESAEREMRISLGVSHTLLMNILAEEIEKRTY